MSYYVHCRDVFEQLWNELNCGGPNRAALAKLRRISIQEDRPDRVDISEVAYVPEAVLALKKLKPDGAHKIERAAAAFSALAMIGEANALHPAKALKRGDFSEQRFIRLLRMETSAELLANGRRLVRILGGRANPGELAADLFLWGANVRTRWAFQFYGEDIPDAIAQSTSDQDIKGASK